MTSIRPHLALVAAFSFALWACQTETTITNQNKLEVKTPSAKEIAKELALRLPEGFKALSAGLDPTVKQFCEGQPFAGEQGYAQSVSKAYRKHLQDWLKLSGFTPPEQTGPGGIYDGSSVTSEVPASPSSTPTPVATSTVQPSSTPAPSTSATSDISVVETTTFNGKVFDDSNAPLDGVTIKARSLNSDNNWSGETVTAGGSFAFNDAPSGIQLEIIASKPGFSSRRRIEVLRSNKGGNPNANRYDFGNDGNVTQFSAGYQALSDLPEVVSVSPGRASTVDLSLNAPVVLTFSEPMNTKTVEDTFALCKVSSSADPNPELLMHAGHFNVQWSDNDTKATFILKPGQTYPEISSGRYSIKFNNPDNNDSVIKDKSGISRDANHFKITDGDFEPSTYFFPTLFSTQMLEEMPQPIYTPLPPPVRPREHFFFSYDDSASTSGVELVKQALNHQKQPQTDWAKPWEFLNYENFDRINQKSLGLFEVSMGLWKYPHLKNPHLDNYEVGIHVSAPYQCKATRPNMVLTLMVDLSTSMDEPAPLTQDGEVKPPTKLEILKFGLKQLAAQIKPGDVINLVGFSNKAFVLLENYEVKDNLDDYFDKVDALETLGGTNLQAGVEQAYRLGEQFFRPKLSNRILLMTDAHENEGTLELAQIQRRVRIREQQGLYFSALGFGNNHNHKLLNDISEAGRGAYYSIVSKTDMLEAMGDRFIPLINVAARDVKFKIEYPGELFHGRSAAEQSSQVASEVQATNFSFNTSQYFWEQFKVNKGQNLGDKTIKLTISYKDPETQTQKIEVLEKSIGEIVDRDVPNIKAAHSVVLLNEAIQGKMGAEEVNTELTQLLN